MMHSRLGAQERRRGSRAGVVAWVAVAMGMFGMVASPTAHAAVAAQTTTMNFSGPQGGPFPSGSTTVPLVNDTGQTIVWRARQSPHWAIFSSTSGVLAPGASSSVQVTIDSSVANLLSVGSYSAFLLYRTLAGQPTGVLADLTLTVDPPGGQATMNTGSRTGGVAPLTIFFDAVGSGTGVYQPSGSNPDYGSVDYRWDFADSASGTWTHNGKSKNTAHGYMAAHVFETVGTHRVTLHVTEASGVVHDYYQDITVTDPNAVYAGQTYYVSNSGGNDSNNGTSPSSPFRTVSRAMSTLFASNGPRRVLFNRGETWTASSTISASGRTGPFTIGAYGTGTNPTINMTHSGDGIRFDTTVRDVRIVDVNVSGPWPASSGEGVQLGRDSLLLRSTVRGFRLGVGGHATNCVANTVQDCAIVDNGDYGMYYSPGAGSGGDNDAIVHLAVMGNRFDNSINNSLLRTYVSRSLWQANLFQRAGQSATRLMGLHTPKKSEFVVIADNRFTSLTAWVLEIGPENSENGGSGGTPQNVENVIVEGNKFSLPTPGAVSRFVLDWGQRVTIRNNVFDHTGASWGGSILVAARGIGPVPVGTRIDNNTVYRATAAGGPWQFVDANSQDSTMVRNNIVYSPLTAPTVAAGTVTETNNLTSNPLFQNSGAGNFALQAGSPAINQGAVLPVRIDYSGSVRPLTPGFLDIGALEKP